MSGRAFAFCEQLSGQAKKAGMEKLHFHLEERAEETTEVFCGEVSAETRATEELLYVEGGYKGKRGCAFTEAFAPEGIPFMLENLRQTALANGQPFEETPLNPCKAPALPEFVGGEAHREKLLAASVAMQKVSPKIKSTTLLYTGRRRRIHLLDERGDCMSDGQAAHYFEARAMAAGEEGAQTLQNHRLAAGPPPIEDIAAEVARGCAGLLLAKPCAAGSYPAVLSGRVMADVLQAYLPMFFGDRVQQGTSLLQGRLGKRIAAPALNLREIPNGVAGRRFDDEGVPTLAKNLIAQGLLENLLYSRSAAKKQGCASLGNGFRPGARAAVGTAATTLLLEEGSYTQAELLAQMGRGIFITACDGVFAGANPTSGDFSLIAKGWLIEGGECARPVNQITMGGNILDVLQAVQAVGAGLETTDDPEQNCVCAPSVLLERLLISS